MMPQTFVPRPTDATLKGCQGRYRKSKRKDAWKAFRADRVCAPCALARLHEAYGARCSYCDHAHGWTIDHVAPKSAKPSVRFDWANWRPACMDCNSKKGTKVVVDPVRRDPRAYLVFNLSTGAPEVIATRRAKRIAEATREMLNNQTLNEARRSARMRMVGVLERVAKGEAAARKDLARLLDRETPHRVMLRELILETDTTLNPYRSIVDAALAVVPGLRAWATTPTTAPSP